MRFPTIKSSCKLQLILVCLTSLILISCGRSKQTQFYILNPITLANKPTARYHHLLIGIDSIKTPAYLEKPQIMVYQTNQQVNMEEFNQWAESLDKTIKRIVATNLSTLLPGSIVENSPWNIQFKPTYHLQISLSLFKIDTQGNSDLRASYLIYHNDQLVTKQDRSYHLKAKVINLDAMIQSMNDNLTHLTRDIANTFQSAQVRDASAKIDSSQ
jgi:uncharacterized lipoprotein YmbA